MIDADDKRFQTCRAQAALHGVVLHKLEGDFGRPIYCATRWALTKQLDTLDEVETWLARVTGQAVKAVAP
jgi:hypothetical protein